MVDNTEAIKDAQRVLLLNLNRVTKEDQEMVVNLLYSIHNQKNKPTNCPPCFMSRQQQIEDWLKTKEKTLIHEYK